MKTNTNWKGIKAAVSASKRCPLYWRIYADYSDRTVWCNAYASNNSWDEYHSDSIREIVAGFGWQSIFGLTSLTMDELREKLEEKEVRHV